MNDKSSFSEKEGPDTQSHLEQTGIDTQSTMTAEPVPKHVPLDQIVRRVTDVSTLPHVALRVMEMANDSDASAADLKTIVEGDPSLSARVLRTVNSSAYAVRSKVTNLHQAISLLGFDQIRNLAITASVSRSFKQDSVIGSYRRAELWRHLVSVGICARLIATRRRMSNFEDAFLAGLLHDFGIILEDQHARKGFKAMMLSLDESRTLVEAEQEYLGFDHTTLGVRLANLWKFPPAVRAAIRFHHLTDKCGDDYAPIVQCVEVANFICTLKGIPSVGLKLIVVPQRTLNELSFKKEDIKILVTDLDDEMARYESLFHL